MGGKFKRDRTKVIVFSTLPRSGCFELKTKRLKLELAITLGSYFPMVIRWGNSHILRRMNEFSLHLNKFGAAKKSCGE